MKFVFWIFISVLGLNSSTYACLSCSDQNSEFQDLDFRQSNRPRQINQDEDFRTMDDQFLSTACQNGGLKACEEVERRQNLKKQKK